MRRECQERFPRHRLQRKPLVSDPGMHHGTCVTHVPWCMLRSLTGGGGGNVPGIPSAYATCDFTYMARSPCSKARFPGHRKGMRNDSIHVSRSFHYNDVIMSTMTYQVTSLTNVYSTVFLGANQRKYQSSALLAFGGGYSPVAGEFPAQRANNAENVSIWWRHHDHCFFIKAWE